MLRITINSYLIVPFLSNLPQPKILRIIFSDLIKNGLVILGRRTIFTNMQNPVHLKLIFAITCPEIPQFTLMINLISA